MARAILTLVTVGVAIYAIVDCWRSRPDEVRYLPKVVWIVAILVFPLMGAVAYLLMGRSDPSGPGGPAAPRRVIAPDDDPDFLRSLETDRRGKREPRGPETQQPPPPEPPKGAKPPKPPKPGRPEQEPPAEPATGDVPADTAGDDEGADGARS
jgi:hypothetical protein